MQEIAVEFVYSSWTTKNGKFYPLSPEIPRDIAFFSSMMAGIVNVYKRVVLFTFISAFFNSSSDFIKDSVSSLKQT